MAKKSKAPEQPPLAPPPAPAPEAAPAADEAVLDGLDLSRVTEVIDGFVAPAADPEPAPAAPPAPTPDCPGWADWVMTHFTESELDPAGRPRVDGLRRVSRALLGPVMASDMRVIQCPAFSPLRRRSTALQPAVAECRLQYQARPGNAFGLEAGETVMVAEAADAYFGNIPDQKFAQFLTAMACTRAEARALRKLLCLRGIAAEEASAVPPVEASVDGKATESQLTFIGVLCRRLDVNVWKFVNSGRRKYERLTDIPYDTAMAMAETLSAWQSDQSRVRQDLVGFDPSWMEGVR